LKTTVAVGAFIAVILCALMACDCNDSEKKVVQRQSVSVPRVPEPISDPNLKNAFKFTDKIWGGAEPAGEEAFRALKNMGVTTVVSVDGARPDVEMARKYGLRYIHLPIGYDEVPQQRVKEIAKALTELPGPFFVHCHHGKHRSPAAVATACVLNGTLSNEEALLAMQAAGTGKNYLGLWASAKAVARMDPSELKELQVVFVAQAPLPPLADAMVEIDKYFEQLKLCKDAGWRTPNNHPDLEPAHEALKLRELISELMLTDSYKNEPRDFKEWTEALETDVKILESALGGLKTSTDKSPPSQIDATILRVEKSCKDCHAKYRNIPQKKGLNRG